MHVLTKTNGWMTANSATGRHLNTHNGKGKCLIQNTLINDQLQ